jgi:hypothetical protein
MYKLRSNPIASKRRKIERTRKKKDFHFGLDFALIGYDFRSKVRA